MLFQRLHDGSIFSVLKLLCYRDQTPTLKHLLQNWKSITHACVMNLATTVTGQEDTSEQKP